MSRVFLLRHGRILLPNEKRRFIGQADLPLSPEGETEALASGCVLGGIPFDLFLSSDLLRAVQTAERIARIIERPFRIEPALREISLGSWEGLEMEAVKKNWPDDYEARGLNFEGFRPPGGESFSDLAERTIPLLEELSSLAGNILVVGHSGVFRVFLATVLGISIRQAFLLHQDTGGIHILANNGNRLYVERLNWKPSL